MNKKGFTLVELLAVIAILAILVIIALPNVLKMFNDSKKNSFMTEVRDIYKQAQTQFIADNMTTPGAKTYSNNLDPACNPATPALEMNGRASTGGQLKYSVSLDTNGNVTAIQVSDGSYYYIADPNASASNKTADAVPSDASKIVIGNIGEGTTAAACTVPTAG